MNPRIEETLSLAASAENELLLRAADCVVSARHLNDAGSRDRLFDEAASLRRIAEFVGAIIRNMEAERDAQRPRLAREQGLSRAHRARLRKLVVLGGGA
jgi:hypothetical protein